MNESKQAMLEAVANLRKQMSKDTIQVGVLLQELDAFEAALRASAPQEDGRALEPVAWQKRPKFGETRLWSYCASPNEDDHQFWLDQEYEIRPLYAAPLSAALTRPQPGGAVAGTERGEVSPASYCALCDLEHELHEDAKGFHHVIKGETVPCPVPRPMLGPTEKTGGGQS